MISFRAFAPANYMSIGNCGPGFRHSSYNTYNLLFSNSKISGLHLFKSGFDARMLAVNNGEATAFDGNFTFAASLTQGPDPTKASLTGGNSIASMLLGLGSGTMTQNAKIADT